MEVLWAFLKLGLTSFGGPVAHLGYFHTEFVKHRKWLDDRSYSDLVALCQFLPGLASSQVGMALGLQRAGWLGMNGLARVWFICCSTLSARWLTHAGGFEVGDHRGPALMVWGRLAC
jgi:chromate transport protein ChrA